MSDFYDIDFSQQAIELSPVDKRTQENVGFIASLLSALQWTRDLIFGSYKKGAIAPAYSPGAYNMFDQVLYQNGVYESLIDENTDLPSAANWRLIQPNFIGMDERILYSANKLIFESALNKWFGTQFRQPPALSDIYITTVPRIVDGFIVGIISSESSDVGRTVSSEFIGESYTAPVNLNFIINIPVAVYNALGANKEQIVRNFADKINAAGLFYSINPY